jgi:xylulokinase
VIVGTDLGTQSVKAVVCDEALVVRGAASAPYPLQLPRPGWAEQDPHDWERALGVAIEAALRNAQVLSTQVRAIGISGQLDGCVPVDFLGEPIGPALIWMDRRATDALPAIDARAFAQTTGQVLDASHMAAKIRWMDRDGDRRGLSRAARFHQPVSYLVERLTGNAVLDPAHASTTMLWDLRAGDWSQPLLDAFEIDRARLPQVDSADSIAGFLTPRGARITGLHVPAVVAVGTGDDFATPLGAGVVAPGTVACVLGTAEVVGALHPTAVIDRAPPLVETHAYPAGGFFVENPGWSAGAALAWLGALVGEDAPSLDRLAAASPIGAEGLTFLPALSGAMAPEWNAGARGAFYGLTGAHGVGHLARAVLESCAFAARDVIDRLASLGVETDRVLLTGGGASSALWPRIRADVTGRPHAIAARTDTCAIGGAMLAAVASGAQPDLATAAKLAPPPAAVVDPDPAARAASDAAYDRYRRLFDALRPLY